MAIENDPAAIGEHARPGMGKAAAITLIVAVAVAGYIVSSAALGMTAVYGGFLFSVYFLGLKGGEMAAFAPSLIGAATGIVLALVFHELPLRFGPVAGGIGALILALAITFALVAQIAPLAFNLATVIFLTVATIPALSTHEALGGMMLSLLYGGGLILLGLLAVRAIARRKAAAAAVGI